jgi:hypothetical protein
MDPLAEGIGKSPEEDIVVLSPCMLGVHIREFCVRKKVKLTCEQCYPGQGGATEASRCYFCTRGLPTMGEVFSIA